jgi:hypothetical protein
VWDAKEGVAVMMMMMIANKKTTLLVGWFDGGLVVSLIGRIKLGKLR